MNRTERWRDTPRRIVVAITGASGTIFGLRLLELMKGLPGIETHAVISKAGGLTMEAECGLRPSHLSELADVVHAAGNIGAPISSGSFRVHAMIIAPCSVKTASNIASGNTADLISRAGDVMLKERRPLLIAIRETPLHLGHIETLQKLATLGAIIFPPVPSFYHRPRTVDDLVNQSCMRMLDQLDITVEAAARWGEQDGVPAVGQPAAAASSPGLADSEDA